MQNAEHKTASVYQRYDIVDEADLVDGPRRLNPVGTLLGTLTQRPPILAVAQSVQVIDSRHMPRWRNWRTHRT